MLTIRLFTLVNFRFLSPTGLAHQLPGIMKRQHMVLGTPLLPLEADQRRQNTVINLLIRGSFHLSCHAIAMASVVTPASALWLLLRVRLPELSCLRRTACSFGFNGVLKQVDANKDERRDKINRPQEAKSSA